MSKISGMELHEKLHRLVAARQWNQSDLARATRIGKSTLSNWWIGRTRPDLDSALAIARALGVPLDFLADDAQDEPPAPPAPPDPRRLALDALIDRLGFDEALDRLARPHGGGYRQNEPDAPPPTRTRRSG